MKNIAETEFEILKLLWRYGNLSSKEMHEKISPETGWSYSTTRTVIERMVKKDLVSKGSFHGLNLYSAGVSKVKVFAAQMSLFAEKILERDAMSLVPLFAKNKVLTAEEIEELKELLASKEQGK